MSGMSGMNGSTIGGVRLLLRLEGALVLALALAAYSQFGMGWSTFAVAFFAPDLALLAYLAGPRIGAGAYNASHSYVGCLVALAGGVLGGVPLLTAVGLIWGAHIGFDRALGYGLKYHHGFQFTHLGRIGRDTQDA